MLNPGAERKKGPREGWWQRRTLLYPEFQQNHSRDLERKKEERESFVFPS